MSSEASTDRAPRGAAPGPASPSEQLQPWQFFTLAALAGATAVVFVSKESTPAAVILLSLTIGAAAFVGVAALRTLGPLAGLAAGRSAEIFGGRTRAALEREKALVLRAIKDLEFDRAMGKVSEKDFGEMSARLRARAAGLLRQLDRGATYRDEIERELARRLPKAPLRDAASRRPGAAVPPACACGTANDPDARFCKNCGRKLHAESPTLDA